jgi:uncharacterized protein YkwD
MIRTTIYGIALGTLALTSAASAISLPDQTFTPKSSHIALLYRQVRYPYLQGSPSPQTSPNSQISQSDSNTAAIEQAVFEQINSYRTSQNLPALTRNSAADNQAKIHSQDMASGQVAFGHSGAQERFKATGIAYKSAGENVAYNSSSDPATKAVQGWLGSPGHLANIKGNFDLTGIGVAKSSDGKVYLTQIFIR